MSYKFPKIVVGGKNEAEFARYRRSIESCFFKIMADHSSPRTKLPYFYSPEVDLLTSWFKKDIPAHLICKAIENTFNDRKELLASTLVDCEVELTRLMSVEETVPDRRQVRRSSDKKP